MSRSVITLVAIERNGQPRDPVGELSDQAREVLTATAGMYARSGFEEPWIGYLVLSGATLVGTCAFASPPVEGRIEIAYFTFPPFEGRGLATAMASELVRIARQQGPALTIAAQTLVEPNASQRILEKLGFRDVASLHLESEGQVLEWQLPTSSG